MISSEKADVYFGGQYLGTTESMTDISSKQKQMAYNKGVKASQNTTIKNKDALCPYPVHDPLRQYWFSGLLDKQYSSKYKHITDETTNQQTDSKTMGK